MLTGQPLVLRPHSLPAPHRPARSPSPCPLAHRPCFPTSLSPLAQHAATSLSYFRFSLAAFVHAVAYLWLVIQAKLHPIFAISPMDKPGCLLLTSGQCPEPKRTKADGGLLGAPASFFFLITIGRNIIFHPPVIASLVTLCHVFELSLVLCRHCLSSLQMFPRGFRESDGRASVFPLVLFPAGSHEERTLPFGLLGSPLPAVTASVNLVVGFLRIPLGPTERLPLWAPTGLPLGKVLWSEALAKVLQEGFYQYQVMSKFFQPSKYVHIITLKLWLFMKGMLILGGSFLPFSWTNWRRERDK